MGKNNGSIITTGKTALLSLQKTFMIVKKIPSISVLVSAESCAFWLTT